MKDFYYKNNNGFTLIELLVVVSIISLLASIIMVSINDARAKARDTERLMDLQQIRTALALYYNDYGKYPSTLGGWWGSCATWGSKGTSGAGGYIPNLAPTYIQVLPLDPKPIAPSNCYVYRSDGVDYNFLAGYGTVEGVVPNSLKRPKTPSEKSFDIYTSDAAGNW